MGKTSISWTDETWNPIVGCSIASPGCDHCYAMGLAGSRLKTHPAYAGLTRQKKGRGPVWNGKTRLLEHKLDEPFRWRKKRMVFVNSMGDLFHENIPFDQIDTIFAIMALNPRHTFQVLTKRAHRMFDYLHGDPDTTPLSQCAEARIGRRAMEIGRARGEDVDEPYWDAFWEWPLPNVWLMVSAENQSYARSRIPSLLRCPAAVRGVSLEPLLGPIRLDQMIVGDPLYVCEEIPEGWPRPLDALRGGTDSGLAPWPALDLVIVGGESGKSARPMHPQWVRDLCDQTVGTPATFHFKQWGEWGPLFCTTTLTDAERRRAKMFEFDQDGERVWSVGNKKRTGRLLDGVTWDRLPERRD